MKPHSHCSALALLNATLLGLVTTAGAQNYNFSVVARGLQRPTGIAVHGNETVYFSELPTPGVPGSMGGSNAVRRLNLEDESITTIHMGEPEPVNLAVGRDDTLYWSCRSAGVILEHAKGVTAPFLTGLDHPTGVAVCRRGNVYFTQVPTPGVGGAMGGMNSVEVTDGESIAPISVGEPEPTDVAVAPDGTVYWTCRTAGVILRKARWGKTRVLLRGLHAPTGIALDHQGRSLYWTEVPTPAVPGDQGGSNQVMELNLACNFVSVVHVGDPEPTDIAVARNGSLYWTCSSAGVIVEARPKHRRH